MAEKKLLHIYCRVSSRAQIQGFSLQAQQEKGIKKAKELGYDYLLFIEPGKSAKYDDVSKLPELSRLLNLIDAGKVTDVFMTETDRMTRSDAYFAVKVKFMRHNVMIHTETGKIDFNNYMDELMADMRAIWNKSENKTKSARSIRGMELAVKKGKWIGANFPYGYKKGADGIMCVDDDEARYYRQMVAWCLEGHGTGTIAKKLNALNVQTRGRKSMPNGTKVVNRYTKSVRQVKNEEFVWKPGTVYCILTNTIQKGERKHKGEVLFAPPIIDTKTWDSVQKQLQKNRNYAVNHGKHNFLLKGLIRCGCCGNNLYGKIKSDERIYMCSSKRYKSCGLRSVNFDRLESVVWERVINSGEHLTQLQVEWNEGGGEVAFNTSTQQLAALKSELLSMEQRSERLVELYELGRIDLEKFDSRKEELQKSIAGIRHKVKAAEEKNADLLRLKNDAESLFAGLQGLWNVKEKLSKLSFEEKRLLLQRLGTDITVFWDLTTRTHRIELRFSVNGFAYAKKAVLRPKGKAGEIAEWSPIWFDSPVTFSKKLFKHEAEYRQGFHITEQARLRYGGASGKGACK